MEYARVDRAAAWALLARLYLNAETYTGTPRYADALTYAKKVIDAGYSLHPDYRQVFMADNDQATNEFIYVIACDGARIQSYGNTTFLVHAACGDDHDEYGVAGGWSGYRTTEAFANLFADKSGNSDQRALFTNLGIPEIKTVSAFAEGIHVRKFINIRSDGKPTNDPKRDFVDIDFPVFRLAEMLLIYAEAHIRGGYQRIEYAYFIKQFHICVLLKFLLVTGILIKIWICGPVCRGNREEFVLVIYPCAG